MKISISILAFISFSFTGLLGQNNTVLETDAGAGDPDRRLLTLSNVNTSTFSAAWMTIQSGDPVSAAEGEIITFANNYNGLPNYAGVFDIHSPDTGVQLRSSNVNGTIKFLTGGNTVSTNTRMFIDPTGRIGIGTSSPGSKLQVNQGDVYIESPNLGIILTAPNNTCYRVTVSNTGSLTSTAIPCP